GRGPSKPARAPTTPAGAEVRDAEGRDKLSDCVLPSVMSLSRPGTSPRRDRLEK
ncbi:mCG130546, isoform CRA_b, partial [Mus musculus]